jgi:hypothetical protein
MSSRKKWHVTCPAPQWFKPDYIILYNTFPELLSSMRTFHHGIYMNILFISLISYDNVYIYIHIHSTCTYIYYISTIWIIYVCINSNKSFFSNGQVILGTQPIPCLELGQAGDGLRMDGRWFSMAFSTCQLENKRFGLLGGHNSWTPKRMRKYTQQNSIVR